MAAGAARQDGHFWQSLLWAGAPGRRTDIVLPGEWAEQTSTTMLRPCSEGAIAADAGWAASMATATQASHAQAPRKALFAARFMGMAIDPGPWQGNVIS